MRVPLQSHLERSIASFLDSALPTTRIYWRREMGLPENIVNDPRNLAEIIENMHPTSSDIAMSDGRKDVGKMSESQAKPLKNGG